MAPYKSIILITLITVIGHMIFLPAGVANPPQPRLYFNASDVDSLRRKIMMEPFNRMVEKLLFVKDKNHWGVADYNPENVYDISTMAENYAFLYILTGEESYAQVSREKTGQLIRSEIAAFPWASRSVKGLTSYRMGRRIAHSYDWCKSSQSWDVAFCDSVSAALTDMGNMIIDYGGTEQNISVNSNWQDNRGAVAGLCLPASDDEMVNDGPGAVGEGSYGQASSFCCLLSFLRLFSLFRNDKRIISNGEISEGGAIVIG